MQSESNLGFVAFTLLLMAWPFAIYFLKQHSPFAMLVGVIAFLLFLIGFAIVKCSRTTVGVIVGLVIFAWTPGLEDGWQLTNGVFWTISGALIGYLWELATTNPPQHSDKS